MFTWMSFTTELTDDELLIVVLLLQFLKAT